MLKEREMMFLWVVCVADERCLLIIAIFFMSLQVEELYEMYCVKWRLCEGAVKMKRAFLHSPSTRACRKSIVELNRNHRHSQQVLPISVYIICALL